ncbi:restriction endonuclease subunit S [Mycoplasmoides pneumoniae]|uniref:restriction endonuclease subunit S n=1 Tax=Mycoplasmoides pneumoniae TaxID=2104 RepID=UPI0035BBF72E
MNDGEVGKIKDCDRDGEYVTWTTGGSYAGAVFYRKGQFNARQDCGVLKVKNEEINPKFLAYALRLQTSKFVNYACPIPKLGISKLAEIELTFPPLEIQEKIADILFAFEKNVTILPKVFPQKLKCVKKQLDYYQNYLFDWVQKQKEGLNSTTLN